MTKAFIIKKKGWNLTCYNECNFGPLNLCPVSPRKIGRGVKLQFHFPWVSVA